MTEQQLKDKFVTGAKVTQDKMHSLISAIFKKQDST